MTGNDPAGGPLQWEGAVNARAVEGLRGLYRMGRHEWLTADGWRQMHDDGVRTVVDLRTAGETGRRETDPEVAEGARAGIRVLLLPTENHGDEEFQKLAGPYLKSPEHYPENLRRWPEKFAAIYAALADAPEGGVVVHCAAGRDRTGMVVAVLQRLLGVPDDVIVAGYQAAVHGINAFHRLQAVPREQPRDDAALARFSAEAGALLRRALTGFDAAEYLLRAGLQPDHLARLQSRYALPEGIRPPVEGSGN